MPLDEVIPVVIDAVFVFSSLKDGYPIARIEPAVQIKVSSVGSEDFTYVEIRVKSVNCLVVVEVKSPICSSVAFFKWCDTANIASNPIAGDNATLQPGEI